MAAKITKTLIDKIRKEFIRTPKSFSITSAALKYDVDVGILTIWANKWKRSIVEAKSPKSDKLPTYTPMDNVNPTLSINQNATAMLDESNRIISESLVMANDISNWLKREIYHKIANGEELTYIKASSGSTDQYGRLTEYLKDIAVITNIAGKFLQPETALKRVKAHAARVESSKADNIPDTPLEAAEYYRQIVRAANDEVDDDEL